MYLIRKKKFQQKKNKTVKISVNITKNGLSSTYSGVKKIVYFVICIDKKQLELATNKTK